MKRIPTICILMAAMLAGLSVPGCSPAGSASTSGSDGRLRVVCTTGQVADILRNVAGEHAVVESLMGSGVDPHLYKASLGDVTQLNAADIVFYSGLHLEGRLASMLEQLSQRKPVYAVTEGVLQNHPEVLRKSPGAKDHYDPHVWFDVSLWSKCVEHATEKLIEHDAARADDYRRNAAAYLAKLAALHTDCQQRLAEVPKERRVLVTAHDAFGYFGDAYDVEVHGLQGISTVDEADLTTANRLVDMLADRKIKAVFVESSVPPKNIRSLIEACAARGHKVVVGGELFSDAMGPEGTPEAEYIGVVEYNVKTIVEALK